MTNFNNTNKGIGSFFSYKKSDSFILSASKTDFIPKNKILFYTGRQAIKYIIDSIINKHQVDTIWLPEYFCKHVTKWLKNIYPNIKNYNVNPSDPDFIINAKIFASNNDIVLVNNFWGISNCYINKSNIKLFIIEDHSHGWLSKSCMESTADFCIASLRKSIPTPLGGIAWKPNGEMINKVDIMVSFEPYKSAWDKTLKAMKLKKTYEDDSSKINQLKEKSLSLVNEAENILHNNFNLTSLNKNHKNYITNYLNINFIDYKSKNLNILKTNLKPKNNINFIGIDKNTFGLILHLNNKELAEKMKAYLISNKIYPSLLWPDNDKKFGYYFNIHSDFRYNSNDMEYIAKMLNDFS
jgi:hypothetical protein